MMNIQKDDGLDYSTEISPTRQTKNAASFHISSELLEQMLQLPEDHYIVGAQWDFISRSLQIFVEGPQLPEIDRGQIVPTLYPSISIKNISGVKEYTWNWHIEDLKNG